MMAFQVVNEWSRSNRVVRKAVGITWKSWVFRREPGHWMFHAGLCGVLVCWYWWSVQYQNDRASCTKEMVRKELLRRAGAKGGEQNGPTLG
jgi:hypothetical protein